MPVTYHHIADVPDHGRERPHRQLHHGRILRQSGIGVDIPFRRDRDHADTDDLALLGEFDVVLHHLDQVRIAGRDLDIEGFTVLHFYRLQGVIHCTGCICGGLSMLIAWFISGPLLAFGGCLAMS